MTAVATEAYESWESVLAGVEEDVRRTEEFLAAAAAPPEDYDPTRLAPAEVMLPIGPEPDLPDITRMPRIPDELLERAAQLRDRIVAVRADLEYALEQAAPRTSLAPVVRLHTVPVPVTPRYIDRAM